MSGRLSCAAGSEETPSDDGAAPKSFVLPAAAVPASEVKKNLRRDQRFMSVPLSCERTGQYTGRERKWEEEDGMPGQSVPKREELRWDCAMARPHGKAKSNLEASSSGDTVGTQMNKAIVVILDSSLEN